MVTDQYVSRLESLEGLEDYANLQSTENPQDSKYALEAFKIVGMLADPN